ncbi:MAG: ATP-binding protein [Bacteroidota bacterium]
MNLIRSILVVLLFAQSSLLLSQTAPSIDTDHHATPNFTGPIDKLGDLARKARQFRSEKKMEEAVQHYYALLQEATHLGDTHLLAKANYALGRIHFKQQDHVGAIKHFNNYLELPLSVVEDKKLARVLNYLGDIYQVIGNYHRSVEYQLEALSYQEKAKDTNGIMKTYYSLGSTFFYYLQQYDKAEQFYQKAFDLAYSIGNENLIKYSMCALGSCFEKQNRLDKAEQFSRDALQMAKETNDTVVQISAYQNMGTTLSLKGQFDEAEESLSQSISLAEQLDHSWGIMVGKKYQGILLKQIGQLKKAEKVLQESLELAVASNNMNQQIELNMQLAQLNEEQGNLIKAYEYTKAFQSLKDSTFDTELIDEIYALEFNGEIQRKTDQIEKNEVTIDQLEEQGKNKQFRILVLWGSVITILLFAALIGFHYWRQRHMYSKLQHTYDLLEEKKREIEEKNARLASVNTDLKQFTYAASHDLKAPLRTIHSFASLLRRRNRQHIDEDSQEYFEFIFGAVHRMQNLLTDLLDYAKLGNEQIPEKVVDLDQVANNSLFNLRNAIEQANAEVLLPEQPLPKVIGHQTQLMQVFQNLVGNAIKFHSDLPPLVKIDFQEKEEHYLFSIHDNGIGIPTGKQEQIFKMFARLNDSTIYEGTGIGLATCKKIIERHGGKIWVVSEPEHGSTFYFTLPRKSIPSSEANRAKSPRKSEKHNTKFQIQD